MEYMIKQKKKGIISYYFLKDNEELIEKLTNDYRNKFFQYTEMAFFGTGCSV